MNENGDEGVKVTQGAVFSVFRERLMSRGDLARKC